VDAEEAFKLELGLDPGWVSPAPQLSADAGATSDAGLPDAGSPPPLSLDAGLAIPPAR
jgi:hypothetical protein